MPIDSPTRYCQWKPCGGAISRTNKNGKRIINSNYNRILTCSPECAGRVRAEKRMINKSPFMHLEAIDYFIRGIVHKMPLTN